MLSVRLVADWEKILRGVEGGILVIDGAKIMDGQRSRDTDRVENIACKKN